MIWSLEQTLKVAEELPQGFVPATEIAYDRKWCQEWKFNKDRKIDPLSKYNAEPPLRQEILDLYLRASR